MPRSVTVSARRERGGAEPGHQIDSDAFARTRYERHRDGRHRGEGPEHHASHDRERSLGADEQISEVHVPLGVIPGRALCRLWHRVSRDGHDSLARPRLDDHPAILRSVAAAFEFEHGPVGNDEGECLHPVPSRTVLEGRRPSGVGRHDAARRRAGERRRRRKPCADGCQRLLHRFNRDTRLDGDAVARHIQHPIHPRRRQNRFAHRRRTARE